MRRPARLLPGLLIGFLLIFGAGGVGAASPSPSSPPPGPPFPEPVNGRAVYDYAGVLDAGDRGAGRADHRRDRGPDQGRGRRLHAGPRPRRHHVRRDGGARARTDGRVGRRPGRDQRRAGHPVRPRHEPGAWPGPALLGVRVRRPLPRPGRAPGGLQGGHAAAPRGRRLRRGHASGAGAGRRGDARLHRATIRCRDRSPARGRRSRSPRSIGPSTTTPASCRRRPWCRRKRRSTGSRHGPARKSSCTPRTAASTRRPRRPRPRPAR